MKTQHTKRPKVSAPRPSNRPAAHKAEDLEASELMWTPCEIRRLVFCTSYCACLLIYIPWTFHLIQTGVVGPTLPGAVSGGGLLGLGGLLLKILQVIRRTL
jgi:hypothetical protein